MHEGPSAERPNRERLQLEIVTVSGDNIQDLENIRRVVDGEKNMDPIKWPKERERYETGGDHCAFLIKSGAEVIGYVEVDVRDDHIPEGADRELCKNLKDYGHIARIGLFPDYRGAGIGYDLLRHAEEWAQAHGVPAMWLDYLPEKEPLVTFYENAGYRVFTDFRDGDKDRWRRIAVKFFSQK